MVSAALKPEYVGFDLQAPKFATVARPGDMHGEISNMAGASMLLHFQNTDRVPSLQAKTFLLKHYDTINIWGQHNGPVYALFQEHPN